MEQGVAGPNPARFNKKKFFVSALKVGDYLMKSYNNCYFSSTSYSLLFVVLCLTGGQVGRPVGHMQEGHVQEGPGPNPV